MCCSDTMTTTRKPSLGLVKVRKTSTTWKKPKDSTKQRRMTKGVRFSSNDEVAFRHVTREELQKTWYQQDDFDSFKSDCKRTIREYAGASGDVSRLDPFKTCLRGVEPHLTRASITSRKMTIMTAVQMVLYEQQSQKSLGHSDPERVREISRVVTMSARSRAITVAAFDAKLCQL